LTNGEKISFDEATNRAIQLSKKASYIDVDWHGLWISPKGEIYDIGKGMKSEHDKWMQEFKGKSEREAIEEGWVRIRYITGGVIVAVKNLFAIPNSVDDLMLTQPTKTVEVIDPQNNYIMLDYADVVDYGVQNAVQRNKRLIVKSSLKKADQEVPCPNCGRLREYTDVIRDGKCDQCEKEGVFSGAEFSTDAVGVNPSMDQGPWASPEDHGATPQQSTFPNTMWDPATDGNPDEQPYSNIASSKKLSKKEIVANPKGRYWIAPDGTEFPLAGVHSSWIKQHPEILKKYGINIKNAVNLQPIYDQMYSSGWTRVSDEPAGTGFLIVVNDIQKLPVYLDDFIAKNFSEGDEIHVGAGNGNVYISDPFPSIQKAVNKALRNPVKASLNKQASSIEDVNGAKVFVNPTIEQVKALLKNSKDNLLRAVLDPATGDLYFWDAWMADHAGIVRYFGLPIDVETVAAGDNYLWTLGDDNEIDWLYEKCARRLQRLKRPNRKQADLSGQTVRDILEVVESSGGITYNMTQGNLAQTNNYSVSVYPEREKVVSVIDFDEIERYIIDNEDLLRDPNNSLGIWSHEGQTWLDVVVTIPNKEQALELGREHGQLTIWDLKNMKEIPTGVVRAFNKQDIAKKAEKSPLTEQQANEISAASCPAYVIAINNFYSANSRGHDKDRSLAYAIDSVKNLEKIDEKRLVEFINTYLSPVK
jgi:hypothetical protein